MTWNEECVNSRNKKCWTWLYNKKYQSDCCGRKILILNMDFKHWTNYFNRSHIYIYISKIHFCTNDMNGSVIARWIKRWIFFFQQNKMKKLTNSGQSWWECLKRLNFMWGSGTYIPQKNGSHLVLLSFAVVDSSLWVISPALGQWSNPESKGK